MGKNDDSILPAQAQTARGPGEGQRNAQDALTDDPAGDRAGLDSTGKSTPAGGMSQEVGDIDDDLDEDLDEDDEDLEEDDDGSLPGRMGGGLAGA